MSPLIEGGSRVAVAASRNQRRRTNGDAAGGWLVGTLARITIIRSRSISCLTNLIVSHPQRSLSGRRVEQRQL